ncbi:MAG: S41 family peptidase [Polyangiales bacterium]
MRPIRYGLPAACVLASFAGGATVGAIAQAAKREDSPHAAVEQFAKVLVQIETRYVDPVDREKIISGAIKGMVAELDPHSEYFPPKEFQEFTGETEGKFGGVGIEVDGTGEFLKVIAPIEGGPAEAAGVIAGDEIIAIDGKDARGIGIEKSVRQMRGDPGTKVEITIRRQSDGGKIYRVPLVRREIHVPSVDQAVLPLSIAYLRIRQFQEKTHDELIDAVGKLKAKLGGKIAGLVLDMRRNPGGLVDQAVAVADEFLDRGLIFSTRGQGKTLEETRATSGGLLVDVPMVVLVDEGSASAAELVAGALQDQKRASIVGLNTYGKGSVQSILALPFGAGLKLTTARYYTPSGRSIQAQGITPDVVVEASQVVQPRALPFLKEKDLVHALSPEGALHVDAGPVIPTLPNPSASVTTSTSTTTSTTITSTTTVVVDGGVGLDSGTGVAANINGKKPDLEKDFQLRMAHEIVTGVLLKRKTP